MLWMLVSSLRRTKQYGQFHTMVRRRNGVRLSTWLAFLYLVHNLQMDEEPDAKLNLWKESEINGQRLTLACLQSINTSYLRGRQQAVRTMNNTIFVRSI